MSANFHTFTTNEPCYPLHAVDPEEQDSPWAVEPETPSDTLLGWIGEVWGSPLQCLKAEGVSRHGE